MRVNADFDRPAIVRPEDREWVPSPAGGVERCMLDRVAISEDGEVARATSLVRFAPGSAFPTHTHGGGEEYLVLDGTFGDETGDFPAGSYVRNPVGTAHAPRTPEGCTILVKLHQFAPGDDAPVNVRTSEVEMQRTATEGLTQAVLHRHESEAGAELVRLVRFAPGTRLDHHAHPGGEELLVLEGGFGDEDGTYEAGTWLRSPAGTGHAPHSENGCLLWIKTGHLARTTAERRAA